MSFAAGKVNKSTVLSGVKLPTRTGLSGGQGRARRRLALSASTACRRSRQAAAVSSGTGRGAECS